jgi:hypothetical protein
VIHLAAREFIRNPAEGEAWAWLSARCRLPGFWERLATQASEAFQIRGTDAALILSVGLTKDTGKQALWIEALGGKVSDRPRQNAALIGAVIEDCETIARGTGCTEIRIEAGTRTALKTRLFRRFGFVETDAEGALVMRKELR